MFKHKKRGAVAATLGIVLALGGTSYAIAAGDIVGTSEGVTPTVASEPAGTSPVIAKSWIRWAQSPVPAEQKALPPAAPQYSQVNFGSNDLDSGGFLVTDQIGQMHAEAGVLLRKASGGSAEVTCDLRMSSLAASSEYVTTFQLSGASKVTLPLVGARKGVAVGSHNVGVRCWATGSPVYMEKVDLHAVVYGASKPAT